MNTGRSFERRLLWVGALTCASFVACAVFAPLLAPGDPGALGDLVQERYAPPSAEHWFGTDILGRDLYSRVLHGARASLGIAVASVALALGLGIGIGVVSAWAGGWIDHLLMRLTDLFLAFPRIFLVLLLVCYVGSGPLWLILVLSATGWMGIARVMRAQVLQIKEHEYILAARAAGLRPIQIVRRHVLPALAGPCWTLAALGIGQAILAESFLSFLGLGLQDPSVSWGMLIRGGRDMILGAWWLAFFPGLAIVTSVLAFHLLSEGLSATRSAERSTSFPQPQRA